jgi:hypothetical protein
VSWQSKDDWGHAYRQRGREGRRRRVDPAGERKKKMFFSSVGPTWQPDTESVSRPGPGWAGYWALLVDSDPSAGFLYFFLIPFLFFFYFFYFEI